MAFFFLRIAGTLPQRWRADINHFTIIWPAIPRNKRGEKETVRFQRNDLAFTSVIRNFTHIRKEIY